MPIVKEVQANIATASAVLAEASGCGRPDRHPTNAKVVLSRPTLVTQSLLAPKSSNSHALAMFVVTEAQAAAIRIIFRQRGEFSAAVELRRLFPGIASTEQAREYARTIASWEPLPRRLRSERPRPLKVS